MWTTLTLVTALSATPGQADRLTLTNARTTYGIQGPTRTSTKFLPGDNLVLSFDIEGIQADENGKVLYTIGLEITNSKGKVQYKQAPRDLEAQNSLGGTSLPAFAHVKIGLDQEPGSYKLKVTVTDRAAKSSAELTHSYDVVAKDFGLVRLATTFDPEGHFPAACVAAGQTLMVNFAAVGFDRSKSGDQPDLAVTLTVLDGDGKPTLAKPFAGAVTKGVPAKVLAVPMQFALALNRAGKFKVEVKATDKVSGKTATLSFPLTVAKAR
jgi:hypothetical protein